MQHCLIFDIGKTNKKAFVFDEDYRIVFETSTHLPETTDEDGDPCEDLDLLQAWIKTTAAQILHDRAWNIKGVNCTTYGASFVHLNAQMQPVTPLYNYLKPFPDDLAQWFLAQYGPAAQLSLETASPFLGHLNSGLQLLWLKHRRPAAFAQIQHSLHLPQWVALVLAQVMGRPAHFGMDMTSIGCHTLLWDFERQNYHRWVSQEGLLSCLATAAPQRGNGLHDSSAALLPYLASVETPFLLISTGTWCISLHPFNNEPLTPAELAQDCLCYLTPEGRPVKAARYFGGKEHELAVERIAATHRVGADFFMFPEVPEHRAAMTAYADFMEELLEKQAASTRLALGQTEVSQIFVDGGFSKNPFYMQGLARRFPDKAVFAAEVAQATALGAAIQLHSEWNRQPLPSHLVDLRGVG